MVAGKALLLAVFSAVLSSAFAGHLSANIHMKHRALNRDLTHPARAPFVSPRALHRRCQARYTYAPTTSEEPTPTAAKEPEPTTTTSEFHEPEPSPEPSPEPEPTDNGNNGGDGGNGGDNGNNSGGGGGGYYGGTNYGQATFYSTGLGACGIVNHDTDYICAVSHILFDNYPGAGNNPNENPVCGRKIKAWVDGNYIELTATDRCEACEATDLDFSPSAFSSVADPARGRVEFHWEWA